MAVKDLFVRKVDDIDEKEIWQVTPWQNDDGITKSEVDHQDELSFEDYLEGGDTSALSAFTTSLEQLGTQNGIYTAVNSLKNVINDGSKSSHRPNRTVEQTDDKLATTLQKIKNSKYKKNVKLSSKLGLYNSYMNLLGNAAGLYIGSLGKNTAEQIADYALDKTKVSDYTLGLGVTSLVRLGKAAFDGGKNKGVFSSVDIPWNDIISLNLANFFTIYSSRPGLTIRSTNNLYQNVVKGGDGRIETLLGLNGKKAELANSAISTVKNSSEQTEKELPMVTSEEYQKMALMHGSMAFEPDSGYNTGNEVFKGKIRTKDTNSNSINNNNNSSEKKGLIRSAIDKINKKLENTSASEYYSYYNYEEWRDKNKPTVLSSSARIKDGLEIGSVSQYIEDWRANKIEDADGFAGTAGKVINYGAYTDVNSRNLPSNAKSNGGLYIEPFYNNSGLNSFFIPFEFNPEIQEGGLKADYQMEQPLGRLLAVRSYTKSDADTTTVTTTYLALEDGYSKKYYTDSWQKFGWDLNTIGEIEKFYRSLTLPYINIKDSAEFVRPPIIRIIPPLTKNSTDFKSLSDLYSYPSSKGDYKITKIFDDNTQVKDRAKRFVAINVQIQPLESWGNNFSAIDYYNNSNVQRKGFKVTVTLAETTKNFLDTIPSYASYVTGAFDSDEINEELSETNVNTMEIEQPSISQEKYASINNSIAVASGRNGMPSNISQAVANPERYSDINSSILENSGYHGMPTNLSNKGKYNSIKESITNNVGSNGMPSSLAKFGL